MGLGHGFHEDGEAGARAQLAGQLLGLRDGVAPLLVGRVHPVHQVLPPRAVRPARSRTTKNKSRFLLLARIISSSRMDCQIGEKE